MLPRCEIRRAVRFDNVTAINIFASASNPKSRTAQWVLNVISGNPWLSASKHQHIGVFSLFIARNTFRQCVWICEDRTTDIG